MKKIKELFLKYKEIIVYLVFGGLTTLLSLVVFWLLTEVLPIAETTLPANVISNAAGIIFAYCTNRKWVFESKVKGFAPIMKEFGKFVGGRIFTVLFDLAFVYVTVDVLKGNDFIFKLVSTVVVVILNYVISKFIVFAKKKKEQKALEADSASVSENNLDDNNQTTDNKDKE